MFEFERECELFGIELKTSKNNNTYTIITVLSCNGKTIDVMYDGNALDFTKLSSRQVYNFHFCLSIGKYTRFYITGIDI